MCLCPSPVPLARAPPCAHTHVHAHAYALNTTPDDPPQLNVLLDFVDGMKSQLSAMDEKLDALGSAIGAMHADVVRLAGRPVLEVYNEWSERTKKVAGSVLPSEGTCRLNNGHTFKKDYMKTKF